MAKEYVPRCDIVQRFVIAMVVKVCNPLLDRLLQFPRDSSSVSA